jgi:hypothetical protein
MWRMTTYADICTAEDFTNATRALDRATVGRCDPDLALTKGLIAHDAHGRP